MTDLSPTYESTSLRQVFLLAWKWAWLAVLLTALAAAGAYTASHFIQPVYQARTTLLINESPGTGTNDYTAILLSERQASTYVEMIINRPLLEAVITSLDLQINPKALAKATHVELIRNTRLIAITIEDTDPQLAATIANAIATQFIQQLVSIETAAYQASKTSLEKQIQQIDQHIQTITAYQDNLEARGYTLTDEQLQNDLAEYRQIYANLSLKYEDVRLAEASASSNVFHLEPAVPSQAPIRPRVWVNTGLAAAFGLVLAVSVAFLFEAMDDTLRTPQDINRHLGLPILGMIPYHETPSAKPITLLEPRSPASDAYRSLRTNIHFASVDQPIKKLLITSCTPDEGKSTLTVNLAVVIAQGGHHTIIVDADFRRPQIHSYLGLTNQHGLSDLMVQSPINLDGNLQTLDSLPLEFLSTGNLPPNPTELLASEKMSAIIASLHEHAEMLMVDTPPMMVVADAAVLIPEMDGVLLVLKPGYTRLAAARQTVDQLRRAKANLLGVVLNNINVQRHGYYRGYYHTYQGYYQPETKKPGLLKRWRKPKS